MASGILTPINRGPLMTGDGCMAAMDAVGRTTKKSRHRHEREKSHENTQKQPAHGGCSASPVRHCRTSWMPWLSIIARRRREDGLLRRIQRSKSGSTQRNLDGAANIARGWAKGMRAGKINLTGSNPPYRCSDRRRTYWRESAKRGSKKLPPQDRKAARLVRMPNDPATAAIERNKCNQNS